ncbi:MAG: sigma-70 family RNA polymerase sigma factor [Gemmatimonadetes bacterium]|nr:sigma-70 family RNA polymerase sigma factor [Gemmatimonadota bacterium]
MTDVTTLFHEHHESLWRFLTRLTGDPDLAADAAQMAFIRCVETPPAPDNIRAWLFRVGRNAALEAARTDTRRTRLLAGGSARVPHSDPFPAADEEYATADRVRRVHTALARLNVRDRTVLLMREEGFAHREIAEAVNTTTGSVGTIVARALEKLATELRLDGELPT